MWTFFPTCVEIVGTPYIGRFEILDNMVAVRSDFGINLDEINAEVKQMEAKLAALGG
ncbi:hypothetical protein [Magnetospirillum fulvum]|uniref:hypothetical protein n=1 Tax=Magnetospirillum fulvum TaxID=1082 RepID=UPI00041425B0|nr:hypothetical protein [Magnetospirillum fulvum]